MLLLETSRLQMRLKPFNPLETHFKERVTFNKREARLLGLFEVEDRLEDDRCVQRKL